MAEHVRCNYDLILGIWFDDTVERAAGRTADFAGVDTCGERRELGWCVKGPFAAAQLRQRLRTCPEVTIVETTDARSPD